MNEHNGYQFIQFVSQIAPANNECWNWTGPVDKDGYGWFQKKRAHRYSYAHFNGSIPTGLFVLHSCDNARCVSPHHLTVGDQLENMRQKVERGRHVCVRGANSPLAKLDDEKVREIRHRFANGETQRALGKEYGMAQGRISMIVNRKSWSHVHD